MRAALFVITAAVLFGTKGAVQSLLPDTVSATSLGAARLVIGGGTLAAVAWLTRHRRSASPGVGRWAVALGAVTIVAYQPLFFLGTARNGVAVGAAVALGSAPIVVGALEWLLTRRAPGVRWLVATATAIAGVGLLASTSSSAGDLLGVAASVGAGASYAVFTLSLKRLLDHGWDADTASGSVYAVAAVLAVPLLATTETSWLTTPIGAGVAAWVGVGTITVAYLFFTRGLARLPGSTVSTLGLTEPITATVLGLTVVGETLHPRQSVGLFALLAAIIFLTLGRQTNPDDEQTSQTHLRRPGSRRPAGGDPRRDAGAGHPAARGASGRRARRVPAHGARRPQPARR